MVDIYSVIEDDEETITGIPVPKNKKLLYRAIVKLIYEHTKEYAKLAIRDRKFLHIVMWKLNVYERMVYELESIVGRNRDVTWLIYQINKIRKVL